MYSQIILITGYARSGTKLLNKILNRAGIVEYVPEFQFFEKIWSCTDPGIKTKADLMNMIQRQCKAMRNGEGRFSDINYMSEFAKKLQNKVKNRQISSPIELYQEILLEAKADYPLCIDTTPRNIYYYPEIRKALPTTKFIFMQRDPRDCILSQKKKYLLYIKKKRWFEALRLWLNYNPIIMAKLWSKSYMIASENQGDNCIVVSYESLTKDPKYACSSLEKFLNVEIKLTDFDFIYSNNSKKWITQLSSSDIYWIQRMISTDIKKAGYELKAFGGKRFLYGWKILWYMLKMPLSLLVNLARFKNPLNAIHRRLGS